MDKKLSISIISGIFFFIPLISYAQNLYLPDFGESVRRFAASGSNNPAFLTEYPLPRVSYLQASASKGSGDFINYNQSDDVRTMGITTESYYRFSDRIMLYGRMSYGLDKGSKMSGSAFIPGYDLPFDLVETVDTCAGDKELEAYTLGGAIGYRLNNSISLGARVYYQAANYAKFKDLRHQNNQAELKVSAGGSYSISPLLTLGLSYTYHRRNQSVEFGIYGNTDRQYTTLIDFGGFFGRNEIFSESGYTADSTPLFTESHGGALQLLLKPGNNVTWFNDITCSAGDGQFGTGDDRDVTFSTHKIKNMGYSGKMVCAAHNDSHVVELSLNSRTTENFENNYKESTDKDGVSQIIYYGKNQVLDRKAYDASAAYTFFKGADAVRSRYSAGGRFSYSYMESTTSLYPFYRRQDISTWRADIYGRYSWFVKKQVFSLSVLLGYGAGGGTMKDDGIYADVTDEQSIPDRRDDLLEQNFDYLTAQRISGSLAFGYERNILKNISAYAVAGVSPRYALDSSFKKDHYLQFDMQIGVKF